MNIVVALKIVPDDQDILVNEDMTLNYSNARPVVSTYDLNAIEAAANLAKDVGAKLTAISVGDSTIIDTKVSKNILARGVDEYIVVADNVYSDFEANETASVLAAAINKMSDVDLIICGDGSSDIYAQQVDVQLSCELNIPVVTSVSEVSMQDGKLLAVRNLENVIETVEVTLPAVISVIPEIALPRICGMKDILAAGKKPVVSYNANDFNVGISKDVEVVSILAPEPKPRKQVILDGAVESDVEMFIAALRDSIR